MIAHLKPYPARKNSGIERLRGIRTDMLALEQEAEGPLGEITGETI